MNPPHTEMNEELLIRWVDGQLTREESARVEQYLAAEPDLRRGKDEAAQLRTLLRAHLPATVEPPSPEFFTSRVMEEIRRDTPAARAPEKKRASRWAWLREEWFAPLASAAALVLIFIIWRPSVPVKEELLVQAYTPDPHITARAYYSDEAQATVIDLQNASVSDDRDIKAFDVASADPPAAGEPQVFYAANDSARPVMVLSLDSAEKPRVTIVH
jgi:anti-sigma factor RsiW